jgi:SAM-dependent methyltransferase
MDILEHNRRAWDRQAEHGNQWTMPVSPDAIAAARRGEWSIVLTPVKPVPHEWLPDLAGKRVLCLASGGGQQGPVLAAAGAQVTVLDNSSNQLERDRFVAEREQLEITTVRGDMADLSMFPGESFDCIVHPVSNLFAPNVLPVWREAFRVLRKGGLEVKYTLPYSDIEHLTEEQQRRWAEAGRPLEFSHTLEDQIGGQIAAGFVITGFYEDRDPDEQDNPLSKFMPVFIATRALKP